MVDDVVSWRIDDRLYIRMEEGRTRMGIDSLLRQGAEQDQILDYVGDQLSDKGFVVAQMDKLVSWAQSGSLAYDLRPCLLC